MSKRKRGGQESKSVQNFRAGLGDRTSAKAAKAPRGANPLAECESGLCGCDDMRRAVLQVSPFSRFPFGIRLLFDATVAIQEAGARSESVALSIKELLDGGLTEADLAGCAGAEYIHFVVMVRPSRGSNEHLQFVPAVVLTEVRSDSGKICARRKGREAGLKPCTLSIGPATHVLLNLANVGEFQVFLRGLLTPWLDGELGILWAHGHVIADFRRAAPLEYLVLNELHQAGWTNKREVQLSTLAPRPRGDHKHRLPNLAVKLDRLLTGVIKFRVTDSGAVIHWRFTEDRVACALSLALEADLMADLGDAAALLYAYWRQTRDHEDTSSVPPLTIAHLRRAGLTDRRLIELALRRNISFFMNGKCLRSTHLTAPASRLSRDCGLLPPELTPQTLVTLTDGTAERIENYGVHRLRPVFEPRRIAVRQIIATNSPSFHVEETLIREVQRPALRECVLLDALAKSSGARYIRNPYLRAAGIESSDTAQRFQKFARFQMQAAIHDFNRRRQSKQLYLASAGGGFSLRWDYCAAE